MRLTVVSFCVLSFNCERSFSILLSEEIHWVTKLWFFLWYISLITILFLVINVVRIGQEKAYILIPCSWGVVDVTWPTQSFRPEKELIIQLLGSDFSNDSSAVLWKVVASPCRVQDAVSCYVVFGVLDKCVIHTLVHEPSRGYRKRDIHDWSWGSHTSPSKKYRMADCWIKTLRHELSLTYDGHWVNSSIYINWQWNSYG